eukprot:TRINITY_DN14982_c0_g1_i1.p1 TRINITY_DN14982_c0_g1~~TRINITY_DN14982_c0_g1_i1.p1  ORF type:complete len:270 (-),score=52.26 TRINITY_DN14982_c0_g1_i1:211-1020(-)
MKGLALRFHSRGLLVTGDTFPVKEELKALKGRWDAMLQGWLFPFDGKQKLLQGLRENGISASMDDRAKVSLVLGGCSQGISVSGETYPIREFLRESGGVWDSKLKGWAFKDVTSTQLAKQLKAFPDVGTVSVENPTSCSIVVLEHPRRPVASPASAKPKALLAASEASPKRLNGKQASSAQGKSKRVSASTANSKSKVEETAKRTVKTTRKEGGSREGLQVDKKRQKISCKSTGAHIQTTSVTKKRRIQETKGKVIETRTVVVKRVRNK